jgi:competence ComEA-like helix-hairpin-helix protein
LVLTLFDRLNKKPKNGLRVLETFGFSSLFLGAIGLLWPYYQPQPHAVTLTRVSRSAEESSLIWSRASLGQPLSPQEKGLALASSASPVLEVEADGRLDADTVEPHPHARKKRKKRHASHRRSKKKKKPSKTLKKPKKVKAIPLKPMPVDLNEATLAQLIALPTLGPKTAQAILDYRRDQGDFLCFETLDAVPGIGKKSLERLKPWVKGASSQGCSVKATKPPTEPLPDRPLP